MGQLPLVPLAVQEASVEVGQSRGRQQHQHGESAQHPETHSAFRETAGLSSSDMENGVNGALSQHIQGGFFLLSCPEPRFSCHLSFIEATSGGRVQPNQDCIFKHEATKKHLNNSSTGARVVLHNAAGPESHSDADVSADQKHLLKLLSETLSLSESTKAFGSFDSFLS